MSKKNVKIYNDGSQFVAILSEPMHAANHDPRGVRIEDPLYTKFIEFYNEAQYKRITKKRKLDYVMDRFVETNEELFDIPSNEELEEYCCRYVSALHKRKVRFRRKAYLNEWTWWTTFTYSDEKMTQDEFEHQIRTKLSDLCSHSGWRAMLRWEEGELNSRVHLHALLYVPEGTMPGEMFLDSQYSYKRHRRETFINNTYFADRFGKTVWERIDDLKGAKNIINYMLKYIEKDNGKIIYSRGIPDHLDAEIDVERDLSAIYTSDYCVKGVVYSNLFRSAKEALKKLCTAFDFEAYYSGSTAEAVPI